MAGGKVAEVALGDDVAARIVAPGFPARGVAHGSAPADGIGGSEGGRAAADGGVLFFRASVVYRCHVYSVKRAEAVIQSAPPDSSEINCKSEQPHHNENPVKGFLIPSKENVCLPFTWLTWLKS